jgi:hypothetical protein
MRSNHRSITWHGQAYQFQTLPKQAPTGEIPLWAVSRRGEFIGIMSCGEMTTEDFDIRSLHWLDQLLGSSGPPQRPTSR